MPIDVQLGPMDDGPADLAIDGAVVAHRRQHLPDPGGASLARENEVGMCAPTLDGRWDDVHGLPRLRDEVCGHVAVRERQTVPQEYQRKRMVGENDIVRYHRFIFHSLRADAGIHDRREGKRYLVLRRHMGDEGRRDRDEAWKDDNGSGRARRYEHRERRFFEVEDRVLRLRGHRRLGGGLQPPRHLVLLRRETNAAHLAQVEVGVLRGLGRRRARGQQRAWAYCRRQSAQPRAPSQKGKERFE
mmetsp:Transcript_98961/g.317323  ORF Transcript_98961/g.317323 Transcript_98961/m.317323 type:complete len:244 (+) Transcript_98961:577-1308(+)